MLYGEAMESVLDRYVYEYLSDLGSRHPSRNVATEYMFWMTRGWLVGRVLVATLIGTIVALAAKGREMTVALTLFMIVLGIVLSLVGVATNGDYEFLFLWALPTVLADAIPIVVGGAIVRTLRSAATTRPSTA